MDKIMVQKGHQLSFNCQHCEEPLGFSVLDTDIHQKTIRCDGCKQSYNFDDETLQRQLKKFEALCRQIVEAEEILSDVSVGIDVGGRQVKVPYKLLLTRFNSVLELEINNKPLSIEFRMEALLDRPEAASS